MSGEWVTVTATEVRPGERVRLASGQEVTATRIEQRFLGLDVMIAFIEDAPERWFKQPVATDAQVEVER